MLQMSLGRNFEFSRPDGQQYINFNNETLIQSSDFLNKNDFYLYYIDIEMVRKHVKVRLCGILMVQALPLKLAHQ